jgi:outer membrane receptor protein involved in Fe transport
VVNSGWRDHGVLVRFDHQAGPGVFSAGWQSDFSRDVERPRNNSQDVRFYNPFEDSHRFTGAYEAGALGPLRRVSLTTFLGTSEARTDQDRAAAPDAPRSIERADVAAKDFHVKASAGRDLATLRLEFGVDVNGRFGLEATETRVDYDRAGSVSQAAAAAAIESARRTNAGGYVQATSAVARLFRVSGGVRADRVTSANRGGFFGTRTTRHGAVSGFAAATAGPFSGLTVTGQVARGFRDPTLSDRYFRGPSGRGFVTGNPALAPERSLQFDLAARYAIGRTHLAAYAYQYRLDDLIERYTTGPDLFFFRNRGRARLRGFELEARHDVGGGFALEAGAAVSRGLARDDGASLDDVAADQVSMLVQKEFARGAFAQIRASLHARDARPGPTEIEAPGARIVDLAGGLRLTRQLELRANVRNLLDDTYYASPDPRWVYAPGRSAVVTLVVEY